MSIESAGPDAAVSEIRSQRQKEIIIQFDVPESQNILGHLGLALNPEKTRVADARQGGFDFLGFAVEVRRNPRTGKRFPLIRPSKKALRRIKAEIKSLTCRRTLSLPKEVVVRKINEVVRGWVGYFRYGNCSREFSALKWFLDERMRTYLRRKHRKRSRGYKAYSYRYLHETLGLIKISVVAPWTQSAKATG